jgi:hypothetical protein
MTPDDHPDLLRRIQCDPIDSRGMPVRRAIQLLDGPESGSDPVAARPDAGFRGPMTGAMRPLMQRSRPPHRPRSSDCSAPAWT